MEMFSTYDISSLVDEEVDFLSICERIALDIEKVVKRGNLLNEGQCRRLSSKILEVFENLQTIKYILRRSSGSTITPFLRLLHRSLEEGKSLVRECAKEAGTAAALFQFQNEIAFQEILCDVWLCRDAIYDTAMIRNPNIGENFLLQDLLKLSLFSSDIESDREDFRRRLERIASDYSGVKVFAYFWRQSQSQKQSLARHLLQKFSCTAQECLSMSSSVCIAGLWNKELEPPWTWGHSNFLGAGSGASGVCRTQWLGVPCARKEFHGQASEVTFLKEASSLSHLKHPRIVNFICCGNGEAKGDRFIAMELMEKSLFDVIEDQKGVHFPLHVAVDIIFQIAKGMCYLHDQGVAHPDLKPQNVVVNRLALTHLRDQYYCVKLVDFGMSKTKVEVSKSDTISLRGVGTTRDRAPEVHPKAHLDKAQWFKVDVYSFAMTCAHVLCLKAPFEDMEQLSELYARLSMGDRPQLPAGLPMELAGILGECWHGNPLLRPPIGDICRWLRVLTFKTAGGNDLRGGYPSIIRDNIEYFDEKDFWAKRFSQGTSNSSTLPMPLPLNSSAAAGQTRKSSSRMSSSVATGQTSYCTAHTHFS